MANKPKARGTRSETLVVNFLRLNGFPGAERRAQRGTKDEGDILVTAGLIAEVKHRTTAATDKQIAQWLLETERERINAGATLGLLIVNRPRKPVADWWTVFRIGDVRNWHSLHWDGLPVRARLADVVVPLRREWGDA